MQIAFSHVQTDTPNTYLLKTDVNATKAQNKELRAIFALAKL